MNKIIFTLIFSFILSILIHYVIFMSVNETLKERKLSFPTTNKKTNEKTGYTSIKYVKLLKKEKIEEKVTKKRTVKNTVPKKKPLKPKKVIKKKEKIKKIPKSIKKVKTIKLPQKKQINLKELFTVKKEQIEKEKKEKELLSQKIQEIKDDLKTLNKLDPITQRYIKLYGEEFFTLSKEQKKYIKNNISLIGKITQKYLEYPRISVRTKQQGVNIVEFMFHPNGDITDLKLIDSSGYTALDRNSVETIRIAYKDYPKPVETTKVRINITYILYAR